jgi:hypothetical protein
MSDGGDEGGGGWGSNPLARWGIYILILIVINVILIAVGAPFFIY